MEEYRAKHGESQPPTVIPHLMRDLPQYHNHNKSDRNNRDSMNIPWYVHSFCFLQRAFPLRPSFTRQVARRF